MASLGHTELAPTLEDLCSLKDELFSSQDHVKSWIHKLWIYIVQSLSNLTDTELSIKIQSTTIILTSYLIVSKVYKICEWEVFLFSEQRVWLWF